MCTLQAVSSSHEALARPGQACSRTVTVLVRVEVAAPASRLQQHGWMIRVTPTDARVGILPSHGDLVSVPPQTGLGPDLHPRPIHGDRHWHGHGDRGTQLAGPSAGTLLCIRGSGDRPGLSRRAQ